MHSQCGADQTLTLLQQFARNGFESVLHLPLHREGKKKACYLFDSRLFSAEALVGGGP